MKALGIGCYTVLAQVTKWEVGGGGGVSGKLFFTFKKGCKTGMTSLFLPLQQSPWEKVISLRIKAQHAE